MTTNRIGGDIPGNTQYHTLPVMTSCRIAKQSQISVMMKKNLGTGHYRFRKLPWQVRAHLVSKGPDSCARYESDAVACFEIATNDTCV